MPLRRACLLARLHDLILDRQRPRERDGGLANGAVPFDEPRRGMRLLSSVVRQCGGFEARDSPGFCNRCAKASSATLARFLQQPVCGMFREYGNFDEKYLVAARICGCGCTAHRL
jgi:hypothetical protein